MSTADRYAIPVETYEWKVPEDFESRFKWEYEDGSPSLHRLYEKGKLQQWNASSRIDWSLRPRSGKSRGAARRVHFDFRLAGVGPG